MKGQLRVCGGEGPRKKGRRKKRKEGDKGEKEN